MVWLILRTHAYYLPYASCQAHAPHPPCLFCWKMWIWHLPLQRHKGPPLAHDHHLSVQRTGTGSSWQGTPECVHQTLSNAVWMLTSTWEKSEGLGGTPNHYVLLVRAGVTGESTACQVSALKTKHKLNLCHKQKRSKMKPSKQCTRVTFAQHACFFILQGNKRQQNP